MLIQQLHDADPAFLAEMRQIVLAEHWNPHHFLGLHPFFNQQKIIRVFRPGAKEVFIHILDKAFPMRQIHQGGIFDIVVPEKIQATDYRIYHQNGLLAHDPYAYHPTWGELDSYLFSKGVHYELFDVMGAHEITHQGTTGVSFVVWAPSAARVSLVGDFNHWDGRVNLMRSMGGSGVWELFIPGLQSKEHYKFEIKTQSGAILIKADPYAFFSEVRPHTSSVVANVDHYKWTDHQWIKRRRPLEGPLNIYEVHLGSWKLNEDGSFINYRELAKQLADYCKQMGFTHIELLPVEEHPLDESWGYQVTGYFSVTSRYGSVEDFQWFINHLHLCGIGVILDWVPAHFPTDHFSLAQFDGTALYEHADPRQGYHPHWNTLIFNYGRKEVSNFLIASALFWLQKMHIDALRVDAVASMLYLDYGRDHGNWIPNVYGGKENIEAIEFIKHLNSIIHERVAHVMTIAEESTSFPGITTPVHLGGLGFDFKWNMGWMNDSLRYFNKDPFFRRYHHHDLTFGLLYAFSEQFILPFSHDEVVHGKGSLLSKMPGDYWQKFANLRLLLSYLICQPGKKLLFMGAELGQWDEWHVKKELQWHLLDYPMHQALHQYVKELNHFYLKHPQLWEQDHHFLGFEWVDFADHHNSVISYRRKQSQGEELLCIHNFTPSYHDIYTLSLKNIVMIQEVFNSDDSRFGGSGKVNLPIKIRPDGCQISIPPLATVIYQIAF